MDKDKKKLLESVLLQRFFVVPSFEIYGGVAGLFDLGAAGSQIRNNLVAAWREHFVVVDDLQEVQCTCLVPEPVLVASGHVAKFADLMVKDTKTGECFRADKVIEEQLQKKISAATGDEKHELQVAFNQADGLSAAETGAMIQRFGITSEAGNPLSEPFPFNLMFGTTIGPSTNARAYLRPETAQGIFMNFRRGLEAARGLPFGIAQVGTAFRNEIAPRNGLLRVREFEQAEIEFFIRDRDAKFANFSIVADEKVVLFSAQQQLGGLEPSTMTVREAVACGLIAHETLGYFMGRCQQFLVSIGLDPAKLRFRQHLPKQLAHYAKDCWDCDCLLYCGWTEIVGIADRSCFDLQVHSKATGQDLSAFIKYDQPIEVDQCIAKPVMKNIAKAFKADAQNIKKTIEEMSTEHCKLMHQNLSQGQTFKVCDVELTSDMVEFKTGKALVHGEQVTPIVIEPSFGIGRILYSILEHSFYVRQEDEQRTVFRFVPRIAPSKIAVIALQNDDRLDPTVKSLITEFRSRGLSTRGDDSGVQIGKKYARFDELGVPFVVTVDFQTVDDNTATLRERDSMQQRRFAIAELPDKIQAALSGKLFSEI